MKPLQLLVVCATILTCSISCGGGGGGGGGSDLGGNACGSLVAKTGSGNEQIFNGESCNQSARTPVVAIYAVFDTAEGPDANFICTGALVTVDDLITSAHCFVTSAQQFGDSLLGFGVFVGGDLGQPLAISNLAIHPFYTGATGSPFDIAMATLSEVPSPPIGPLPVLLSQPSLPGQEFSVFGYGTNNFGQVGELKSAEFVIEAIDGGNLLSTFPGSRNVSICAGDSGGPAVQVVNGVTTLIGVNSFTVNPLGIACPTLPALISGFVDIQNAATLDFIANYAPDIPTN